MRTVHVEMGSRLVGGPQQVVYLLEGLLARGVASVLVCQPGSPLARHFAGTAVEVRELRFGGDADLGFIPRLLRLLRAERPDLVHLHSGTAAAQGGIAARLAGIPSVLSRRVDNAPSGLLSRWSYGWLNTRIVAISAAIHDVLVLSGVDPRRLVTIRSSVDAAAWQQPATRPAFLSEFALPPDAVTIGIVAQLIARKGHGTFLRAVAGHLPPATRILVFGEGPLRRELERLARELGLGDHVRFTGHRTDLPRWMGHLDLVVHPALTEGLGVALLQAAAAGIPVVASAAGGIAEIVADGVSGRLVQPGDLPALRAAILDLLADPALRADMGRAARHRALREFGSDAMVEHHIALYREILRRR